MLLDVRPAGFRYKRLRATAKEKEPEAIKITKKLSVR
jgi:hypothetical protein